MESKININLEDTLKYYNTNAEEFIEDTIKVDMNFSRNRFLAYVKDGGEILDFGCGSGRDSKAFMDLGYNVDAIDGSKTMCEITSEYLGLHVECMRFNDLDETDKYDGIWACASILHLNQEELRDVFLKMNKALRKDGVIYASFKLGEFEGEKNGRYFTYMTVDRLEHLIEDLQVKDMWITCDGRNGRKSEKWLNIILKDKK